MSALTPTERALRAKLEKEWQNEVLDVLHWHGWTTYHTFDSRRSDPGFPDVVASKRADLFVAELKRETEQPTPAQRAWLARFMLRGIDAYVWRPSDMDAVIERASR
jgi:hypothetical protein